MALQNLGFDEWFQEKFSQFPEGEFSPARVIAVNKNSYLIGNGETEIFAELTGKFLFGAVSALDLPTVGDWVAVKYFDDDTFAVIYDLLPRRSLLKRKDPGKIDYQLIAANVDFAFIVQSLDANFNLNRLERYLVTVNEGGLQPVILLGKSDLVSEENRVEKLAGVSMLYKDYPAISFSNVTGQGIDLILEQFVPGKSYCLLGSSGVGKTTLLNRLVGEDRFVVKEVREKDRRGRHATTRRQLIRLENGSLIIDTPGMRELGNIDVDAGLSETFEDIYTYSLACRFKDCTHTHEKDCAVLAAVRNGDIDEKRYENYMKILRESDYYSRSYVEKRKRDKEFGKMVKRIMKDYKKK